MSGWRYPFLLVGSLSMLWAGMVYFRVRYHCPAPLPVAVPDQSLAPKPLHLAPSMAQLSLGQQPSPLHAVSVSFTRAGEYCVCVFTSFCCCMQPNTDSFCGLVCLESGGFPFHCFVPCLTFVFAARLGQTARAGSRAHFF